MAEETHFLNHFYYQVPRDTEVLEKNVNDFPYSSFADVLLLYHYKKTNHPGFEKLAKKAALHFKNPHWLQFLLDQPSSEKLVETIINNPSEEIKEVQEAISETESLTNDGEYSPDITGNYETSQSLNENNINEPGEINTYTPHHDEKSELPQVEEIHAEPLREILQEQNLRDEYTGVAENEEEPTEIAFEPLHTVDYFASQGIKLTGEPLTNDKLGNQMKSFTAWLKSMKKLHPSKLEEQNVATEKIIQNSAEESNINTEILTEAMAEVLIKQDKKDKAIEMFNKLSLINPAKSAYFAAKIESIKSL